MEDLFQESHIAGSLLPLFNIIDLHGRPGLHGRIHIAEIPFIRRQLPIGFHIPLPHDQQQLVFGKGGVNHCH
ncbi:hypothetical protein D9M68_1005360 [compost metagenome]